jgi:hypothetical protein
MASNFPTSADTFVTKAGVTATGDTLGAPDHAQAHEDEGAAILAVENFLLDLKAYLTAGDPRPTPTNAVWKRIATLLDTVPADGDMNDSEAIPYWDASSGSLVVKGHLDTGTVVTRTFADGFAYRNADLGRTSTTSITADPQLKTFGPANSVGPYRAVVVYSADAAGDIKAQMNLPSGATFVGRIAGAGADGSTGWDGSAITVDGGGASLKKVFVIDGLVTVGATAGDVGLSWAQATSSAVTTTVYTGSWIRYEAR